MAVRNALKSSGADLKELDKKPKIEAKQLVKKELNEDVVVVRGAGGAGLVAAIEAKNNSAKDVKYT